MCKQSFLSGDRNHISNYFVICLTHLGFDGKPDEFTDQVLVSRTRNVDLVVGGHSHTYLKEVFYKENLDGQPVPIVQNWCWGLNMANLKLEKPDSHNGK